MYIYMNIHTNIARFNWIVVNLLTRSLFFCHLNKQCVTWLVYTYEMTHVFLSLKVQNPLICGPYTHKQTNGHTYKNTPTHTHMTRPRSRVMLLYVFKFLVITLHFEMNHTWTTLISSELFQYCFGK